MKKTVFGTCIVAFIALLVPHLCYSLTPMPLEVKRIEVYFENNRPETTVAKDTDKLKAYARITFAYSGLLEGYWEVDGRILSFVSQHLTSGNAVVIETPQVAALPTFDAGTHVVKFVITGPSARTVPAPSLLYFVATRSEETKPQIITLIKPSDKAPMGYKAPAFGWERLSTRATYIVQFFKEKGGLPLFSACTLDAAYVLPQTIFTTLFAPGERYYWKVTGSDDKVQGESALSEFHFDAMK